MSIPSQRTVFMGTAEFAVPSLRALLSAGHEVVAVVTQPDKPQGRKQILVPSPVKQCAEELGLTVLQPRRVRAESFQRKMFALAPDVLAVAAFGQIVPQSLLDLPRIAPINVHGSLLPKYRGAAPIQRALIAGESETGVTTIWMDATLDTGDTLLMESLPIAPDDTSGTLAQKLSEMGASLLLKTIEGLVQRSLSRTPQLGSLSTYAAMLEL
ncbi:MAG: methionyl-tRNA formyltransferase [Armatimonadetes bacterium]|nr:methionyl-tRNA formyltransferase [Armatimonadota bacterium]